MAEDDFIQEEYEPSSNSNTYIESIKFNDDFATKSTSSEKSVHEPKETIKQRPINREAIKPKLKVEKKEELIQKKLIRPSAEKAVLVRKEPEKNSTKKKHVPSKINNKKDSEDDDTINISFGFFKKLKKFFNKQDKSSIIITLIALAAIVGIALLIINLDKIFPDKGFPVAFVNGEMITDKDVENTLNTIPAIYRSQITEEEILNQTIINKLLLQEANKAGISVTDDEVESVIDKTLANVQMSKNDFKAYLAEQNLTYEDMQSFYKINLAVEKLLEKTAYVGVNVTRRQITDFYYNNTDQLVNLTFEEVEEQIESYLLQQEKAKALSIYINGLMNVSEIRILSKTTPETSETNFSSEEVEEYASCASENGLDKNDVIFIYSDSCPHCQRMKPIVTDLESENYQFKWASVSDGDLNAVLGKCYKDVLAGGVPQFICAKNGQTLVGEKSKEVLKEFVASCNQ